MASANANRLRELRAKSSVNYGGFDVNKNDWRYANNPSSATNQNRGFVFYNSKDPNQKFVTDRNSAEQIDLIDYGVGRDDAYSGTDDIGQLKSLSELANDKRTAENTAKINAGQMTADQADAINNTPIAPTPFSDSPENLKNYAQPFEDESNEKRSKFIGDAANQNIRRGEKIYSSRGKSPIDLVKEIEQFSTSPAPMPEISNVYSRDVANQQAAINAANYGKPGFVPLKVDGILGKLTQQAIITYGQGNQPNVESNGGVSGTPSGNVSGVGTSTQARREKREREQILERGQQTLGMGDAPEAQDLFKKTDEKALAVARNDKTAIESELADIQGAKMALEDEFRKYKVQSGREISQSGYEGGLSEKSRELQFQADTLARKEFVLETKLQSRNDTINELMRNQQLDYASAVDAYNTKFSQSLQLYGIFKGEQDELKTNALASADLMINSIKDNPTAFSNPTQSQLRKWSEYEVQAGLLEGYIQSIAKVASQANGFEYKGTLGSESTGWSSIWINPTTGEQKILAVKGGVSPSDGSIPGENTQLYSGLSSKTATAVRSQVSSFKTEQGVQNFTQVQEGKNFANSLSNTTTNPADDQGLIYSLAKVLDPGSVVREGEYATAQKYAQSWVQAYGKSITQALAGTGFLSETARKNIKATIDAKYNASQKTYDNLYNGYVTSINNLTGRSDGDKFLKDYSTSSSSSEVSSSSLPSNIQQTITSNLTFSPDNKTAYIPRAIWSTLGQYMDAILEEAKNDGITLLIK